MTAINSTLTKDSLVPSMFPIHCHRFHRLLIPAFLVLLSACTTQAIDQGPETPASPELTTEPADSTDLPPDTDLAAAPETTPEPPVVAEAPQCSMGLGFVHKTKHHGYRKIYEGTGSLFFTTPFAVNTDGAPTSYHPDDPFGSQGLAINTICNGANTYLPSGEKLNHENCSELVSAFKQARDAGWSGAGTPRMEFYGVATRDERRSVPCTISSGPYSGYFVSTTSQPADPSRGNCEQERYLDSLELPFIIYPGAAEIRNRGFGKRDVAVLFNPDTGVTEYAIVGDKGPKWGLGEGSVFVSKSLRQISENPTSRRDTYNFVVNKVHALILTESSIEPPFTLEKIRAEGKEALDAWGGEARFRACVAEYGDDAVR